jgi:hypothetical protein
VSVSRFEQRKNSNTDPIAYRRRYKEFQFWLLSDQLLYGEMTPLGLFTLNRQILLARCKVSVLEEGDTDAKTAFIIESPAKSFKIKAK